MKFGLLLLMFLFYSFQPKAAFGFPEMIRYNYVNCTSCHVSPNGGGILNDYGREVSLAAVSTWGTEDEAKPFYNAFNKPKDVDFGAFIRGVQTAQNNSQVSSGYFWWMEADFEAAIKFGGAAKKWTADLSLGLSPDVLNKLLPKGVSPLSSRRQYLMYRPTEITSVRAGKFLPDYGVYSADHTIATRQGIGFDEGNETYNFEYGVQAENWSGSLTAILGRPDDTSLMVEKGGVASGAINLTDHSKLGLSSYLGAENGNSRELIGPYFLLGFTEQLYFLGEADFQWRQFSGNATNQGLFTSGKLGYDIFQGLQVYLMGQTFTHAFSGSYQPLPQDLKYGLVTNRLYGIGPGIYWFPRPHFYFQLEVQQRYSAEMPSSQMSAFLTGSIYL